MHHLMLDEFALAIIDMKAAMLSKSNFFEPHIGLATAYSMSKNYVDVRAAYQCVDKFYPEFSAAILTSVSGTLHPRYVEKWLDGLRKARMQEE